MSDQAAPTPDPTDTRPSVIHGLVDDPAELQTGDFGLNGDLRATMLDALERNWNTEDPGSTTLPPTPADTDQAGTPPTPAPTSPTGEDAGAGGDAAAGDGAAPESAAAPPASAPPGTPTPPPADDFTLDAYAEEYFGTKLSRDQARELFGVLGGLQALTPEQRAELDRVLSGGAQGQYPATTGTPAAQPPAPTPPATSSILPPRPDDEYEAQIYDKYIAPLAQVIEGRVGTVEQQIAATTQAQLAAQRAENDRRIAAASESWRASHPDLTDGEYDALADRVIRSGQFGPTIHAHGGDAAAATNAILDQFYWSDPNLRARAIANLASGRAAGDHATPDPNSQVTQDANAAATERQARAASVAGGGGAATPRGAAPTPNTPEARKQAMIQTLAAEGDFSR